MTSFMYIGHHIIISLAFCACDIHVSIYDNEQWRQRQIIRLYLSLHNKMQSSYRQLRIYWKNDQLFFFAKRYSTNIFLTEGWQNWDDVASNLYCNSLHGLPLLYISSAFHGEWLRIFYMILCCSLFHMVNWTSPHKIGERVYQTQT